MKYNDGWHVTTLEGSSCRVKNENEKKAPAWLPFRRGGEGAKTGGHQGKHLIEKRDPHHPRQGLQKENEKKYRIRSKKKIF